MMAFLDLFMSGTLGDRITAMVALSGSIILLTLIRIAYKKGVIG